MGSLLVLCCNIQSYVVDLSYSYLYLYDICPVVSDIEFMISLLCYYMLCLVRQLVLDNFYMLQYSYACSSMMSVHLKSGGSARDTRVSLTPSVLKCKAFWFVLSQTVPSLTKFYRKK